MSYRQGEKELRDFENFLKKNKEEDQNYKLRQLPRYDPESSIINIFQEDDPTGEIDYYIENLYFKSMGKKVLIVAKKRREDKLPNSLEEIKLMELSDKINILC